jgi:hypothetical protein
MATLALLLFPISLALATQGSIDDLPQVVLDALSVAVPNMTVTEVEYSEEDDGIEYEVHGIWETREVEALLNEQGDILEMQIGDPEDDNIGDLPSSITSELNNLFDEPSINSFEWISAAGLDYFDIQATVNGHPTQIKITQEGQLLWVETPDFSIDPANGTAIPYSELPGATGSPMFLNLRSAPILTSGTAMAMTTQMDSSFRKRPIPSTHRRFLKSCPSPAAIPKTCSKSK